MFRQTALMTGFSSCMQGESGRARPQDKNVEPMYSGEADEPIAMDVDGDVSKELYYSIGFIR